MKSSIPADLLAGGLFDRINSWVHGDATNYEDVAALCLTLAKRLDEIAKQKRIPLRVQRCSTHHAACDCREWYRDELELALRIIQTWASCDHLSNEPRESAMEAIKSKCKQALELGKAQK
jgi:hypothetical protein